MNARTLVGLAALCGRLQNQVHLLQWLSPSFMRATRGYRWSDVSGEFRTIKEDDLVSGAFVLGIESSGVLSLPATLGLVLANSDLAEALAKVASCVDNVGVASTNLARGLVATGDMSKIVEAERSQRKGAELCGPSVPMVAGCAKRNQRQAVSERLGPKNQGYGAL